MCVECLNYCNGQCYNNTCQYFDAPEGNYPYNSKWPGGASNPTNIIMDENIIQLRAAIDGERARRTANPLYPNYAVKSYISIQGSDENSPDGGSVIQGKTGTVGAIKELKDAINEVENLVSFGITDGSTVVTLAQLNALKNAINSLRNQCLCANYCGGKATCSCYTNCSCFYGSNGCQTNVPCVTDYDGCNPHGY